MLLKDKVVIVSGIGPGLGVKLAIEAAREGAKAVIMGARTAAKLDDAEKRVAEVNPKCVAIKVVTDITDRKQCEALVDAAVKKFNRADALARLQALVDSVAAPPRVRRATKPTLGSVRRRLEGKTQRAEVKKLRGRVQD